MDVNARDTNTQHQGVGGTLFCAERPPLFVSCHLAIGPSSDPPGFRSLDARRRIVFQQSLFDRVPNKDAAAGRAAPCATIAEHQ